MLQVQALYLGGLEDINRLSGLGRLQAEQTQILVGCAAWTPGQLHNEVWAGCWHVLAASSNFLHDCVFGKMHEEAHIISASFLCYDMQF